MLTYVEMYPALKLMSGHMAVKYCPFCILGCWDCCTSSVLYPQILFGSDSGLNKYKCIREFLSKEPANVMKSCNESLFDGVLTQLLKSKQIRTEWANWEEGF